MKKLRIIFILFCLFFAFSAWAASKTATVNVNATVAVSSVCGNNIVEGSEACDGAVASCSSLGFSCGTRSCTASCTLDSTCSNSCNPPPAAICGNGGSRDPDRGDPEVGEDCDFGSADNGQCPKKCSSACQRNYCALVIDNVQANFASCASEKITWTTKYSDGASATTNDNEIGWGIATDNEATTTASNGASHEATAVGLVQGNTYKYYVYSSDGTLSKTVNNKNFYFSCSIDNPAIIVEAIDQGIKISVSYPNAGNIAKVVMRRSINGTDAPFFTINESRPASGNETFYDPYLAGDYNQRDIAAHTTINANYCYTVSVCNSFNICSSGASNCAKRIRPPEVSGLGATGANRSVSLSWTNPADDPGQDFAFSEVKLIQVSGNCATAGVNSGTEKAHGNITGFTENNLTNNTTYQYKVFVKNAYGEYSSGLCISATPTGVPEARCISNVNVSYGNGQVSLNWTNPASEAGVFTLNNVAWRRSSACVSSASAGTGVYSGLGESHLDSGLTNGQVYAYAAFVNGAYSCGCYVGTPTGTEPPIEPPPGGQTADFPVYFFGNHGGLPLNPDSSSRIHTASNANLTIEILRADLPKTADLIVVKLNGQNYLLALDASQQKYQTSFEAPNIPTEYNLEISVLYADREQKDYLWRLKVWPSGTITGGLAGQDLVPGATITLQKDGVDFVGFGVENPQTSNADALYVFTLPNGSYRVKIAAGGYKPFLSGQIEVVSNILNQNFNLDKDQPIIAQIIENPGQIITGTIKAVRQPAVQKTNSVAAPAAAAVVSVSAVTAIPWWTLFNYLQYLFTQPLAWLMRRKRQGWGMVYNSITKQPIDLAIIRLYDAKTHRLLQSKITDREGRYSFLVDSGEYYLEAVKRNFIFPSEILKGLSEDGKFLDLYHGHTITVKEGKEGVIIANIPMDQADVHVTDRQILRRHFWQGVRRNIAIVGPIFAVVSFLVSPSIFTAILILVHLAVFWLFRRLAMPKKPRSWGVVYDQNSKQLLGKSVVRIFSPEYNKMLDVQVADRYGRYGFLAGHNVYFLTGAKEGYKEFKTGNIDLRGKATDDVLGQDLALDKNKNGHNHHQVPAPEPLPEKSELEMKSEELKQEIESPAAAKIEVAEPLPKIEDHAKLEGAAAAPAMPETPSAPPEKIIPPEPSLLEEEAEKLKKELEEKNKDQ